VGGDDFDGFKTVDLLSFAEDLVEALPRS